jgi:hypothetical protein
MLTFAGVAAQTCVLIWALACDDSSGRSDVSVIDSGVWAVDEASPPIHRTRFTSGVVGLVSYAERALWSRTAMPRQKKIP